MDSFDGNVLEYIYESIYRRCLMFKVTKSDLMQVFLFWLGHDAMDERIDSLLEEFPEVKEEVKKSDKLLLQGALMLLDDLGVELVDENEG